MSVDGTADFRKAAHALNLAGDKEVRKAVSKAFRIAATPLGKAMVAGLAADMPKRGGYSEIVAGAKPSIRNGFTGSNPRVEIALRSPGHKRAFKALNDGDLRHPAFVKKGQPRKTWRWAAQSVPAGGATRAFDEGAPVVRALLLRELTQVMNDTARKGSS